MVVITLLNWGNDMKISLKIKKIKRHCILGSVFRTGFPQFPHMGFSALLVWMSKQKRQLAPQKQVGIG